MTNQNKIRNWSWFVLCLWVGLWEGHIINPIFPPMPRLISNLEIGLTLVLSFSIALLLIFSYRLGSLDSAVRGLALGLFLGLSFISLVSTAFELGLGLIFMLIPVFTLGIRHKIMTILGLGLSLWAAIVLKFVFRSIWFSLDPLITLCLWIINGIAVWYIVEQFKSSVRKIIDRRISVS